VALLLEGEGDEPRAVAAGSVVLSEGGDEVGRLCASVAEPVCEVLRLVVAREDVVVEAADGAIPIVDKMEGLTDGNNAVSNK
jgi:hypothetical protein